MRDVQQVCLNGHQITEAAVARPEEKSDHCPKCGEKTITACGCGAPIPGRKPKLHGFSTPLAYCGKCGSAFPWTEKRYQALEGILDVMDGLTDAERAQLKKSIGDLIRDTPSTPLAATLAKTAMTKTSAALGKAFRGVLEKVATEAAKKILGLE